MNELEQEKMLDLFILKATGGITKEELEQLSKLEEVFPEFKDDISFELTTAAISLIDLKIEEQMPAHLQARILADTDKYFAAPEKETGGSSNGETEEFQKTFVFDQPKKSIWQSLGWLVATLAGIALAINLWITYNRPKEIIVQNPPQQITPTPTPGLAEQRQQLVASGNAAQKSWSDFDPKKPRNIEGDVVWSNTAQKGFVSFKNLPVNDKSKESYQVWIFDETQKNPVSAGVFDANEAGEIIIPINAAIKINKPTMVGITAEKPGG
ncbi:MAG: anti-sigma factor, partial [Pyrinomonadaceae bacterium]